MKQSKYSISDYWYKRISQGEEFWSGLFENHPITSESLIINPSILNPYSNQHESGWAVYPTPHSVLGFLQFIFLPTAFIGLIKGDKADSKYYFQYDLDEVLIEFKEEFPEKITIINNMERLYNDLLDLWQLDEKLCKEKLIEWAKQFNSDWFKDEYASLSFNLFTTPYDAGEFILKIYEEDLGIDSFEDDIGITKEEFLNLIGKEMFENDFMKRRFTDILTNRLNVTF